MKIKKTIEPEDITVICDSREQVPLDMTPLKMVRGTLVTADYSVLGLENHIAIEKKSIDDLVACCGRERERFDKCIQRMLAYPVRALVVIAEWHHIEQRLYYGKMEPTAIMGSCMSWIAQGVPVIMMGDHARASKWVARMLFIAARRRWLENYPLMQSLQASQGEL